jgi:hypothetical protein
MLWGEVKNSASFADLWTSFRAVSVSNGSGHESMKRSISTERPRALGHGKSAPKNIAHAMTLNLKEVMTKYKVLV